MTLALALVLAAAPQWLGPKPKSADALQRIVTLAPSLTETVEALGAGALLVGVSRYDEAPSVAKLPRVGGFNDPSVEAVVALKPDLVIVQLAPSNQQPVEAMARVGVPVLALSLTSIDDTLTATRELGRVLGRVERATTLNATLTAALTDTRSRSAKRAGSPRVLFVYGFSPLVVAGPRSFAHELLEAVGAKNIAAAAPSAYPVYSLERAVALKPDVIIDAADTADGREQVRQLGSLKQARWVTLRSKALLHPGPALATGLLELERLVWP